MARNPRKPTTDEQLKAAVREEWNRIDVSIFENLHRSMPERMAQVIKGKGVPIRY